MQRNNRGPETLKRLYSQMQSIVTETILNNMDYMIAENLKLGAEPGQLFQHTRWDFLLKSDMTVHLLEVKDSPPVDDNPAILKSVMGLTGIKDWNYDGLSRHTSD